MYKLFILGGIGVLSVFTFVFVHAAGPAVANWSIVPKSEVIDGDYGAVSEVVRISGTVIGDVYVAGGQVFVDGRVDGDVLAVGGVVHITGEVTQNVRAAGGEVVISGTIGRNVTVAGMNVTFDDAALVQGNVVIGGANVFLFSPVGKNLRVAGRNLTLTSIVRGNVEAAVENIGLTGDARVDGDFTYWSNRDAQIDEGTIILGTTARKAPNQFTGVVTSTTSSARQWVQPVFDILNFVTTFVLALLLVRFLPGFSVAVVQTLRTSRWRSLGTGITVLLLTPVVFGLLIITIVGIPLGFLLLFVSSMLLYLARIFVMLFIGQVIVDHVIVAWRGKGQWFVMSLGFLVYFLISLIPVIGWLVSFGAMVFGLGAMVETLKELYAKTKKGSEA